MTKRKEMGRYLKSIRNERGMSQQKLSESLGYKTMGTIHGVEAGVAPLPVEKIHPLAKALDIDVQDLLEKLKECEPELYAKYKALQRDIAGHIMGRILEEKKLTAYILSDIAAAGISATETPAGKKHLNFSAIYADERKQIPLFDMEAYYDTSHGSQDICFAGT